MYGIRTLFVCEEGEAGGAGEGGGWSGSRKLCGRALFHPRSCSLSIREHM